MGRGVGQDERKIQIKVNPTQVRVLLFHPVRTYYLRGIDPHGVLKLVLEPPGLRLQPVGVPLAGDDEARPGAQFNMRNYG